MNLIQKRLIAKKFTDYPLKKDFAFMFVNELDKLRDVIIKLNDEKLFNLSNEERIKKLEDAGFIKDDKVVIPTGAILIDSENYSLYNERTFTYNGNEIKIKDRTDNNEFMENYL